MVDRSEVKRKETIIKMGAPKPDSPVLDMYDCTKVSPYQTEEVLADKVWKVAYKMESFSGFFNTNIEHRKGAKVLFGDVNNKDYQEKLLKAAEVYGDKAVEATKKVAV